MKILDLGGGFPAHAMTPELIEILKKTNQDDFRIVAEPGRHFS